MSSDRENSLAVTVNLEHEDLWSTQTYSNAPPDASQHRCMVCDDPARGFNFNAITCISCKAFFRRNGTRPLDQFICRLNNQCSITALSRRECTACRLRKCFAVGTQKHLIRTGEENERRRNLVKTNRQIREEKLQLKLKKRLKILPECRHAMVCSKSDKLEEHLKKLLTLFDTAARNNLTPNSSINFTEDLIEVLNSHFYILSSFLGFIKDLSHFQCLTIDERVLLVKRNLRFLIPMLMYLHHSAFHLHLLLSHPGINHFNIQLISIYSNVGSVIPADNYLILLCTLILLFCPGLSPTDQSKHHGEMSEQSQQRIGHGYDEYATLLWLYLYERFSIDDKGRVMFLLKLNNLFLRFQQSISETFDRDGSITSDDSIAFIFHLINKIRKTSKSSTQMTVIYHRRCLFLRKWNHGYVHRSLILLYRSPFGQDICSSR